MAVTFDREPSLNGWTLVGNSNSQAAPGFGGWAGGSSTANFNIYSTTFTLANGDTVSAPTTGSAAGDCFLASYASGGGAASAVPGCTAPDAAQNRNPGTTWINGDTIVAYGLKWAPGQQGSLGQPPITFRFDPQGTSGFSAGTAFSTAGNTDFTTGSSDGSLAFNAYPQATPPQNRNPYSAYNVNPGPGINNGNIYMPYGDIVANENNLSTIRQEGNCSGSPAACNPQGTLPVRSFGNLNGNGWDYYTVYLNQSLMQRNNNGQAQFTAQAKWAFTAYQLNGGQISAASYSFGGPSQSVPGPLPLLGAGAAFGWSRRLRRQLKASSALAIKRSI